MANARYGTTLRHIGALFNVGTIGGLTDGELLERFRTSNGEAAELAFAALVERHGAMVLRVCQSVLFETHDAQDAFQATFLVLVRKAGTIRNRDSLASWLHGVAHRIAACAKAATARRRRHERAAAERAMTSTGNGDGDDLAPVLHEELERLPEKYRIPIVLCHLEGLTHEQTAHQLRWPVGTVRSRLARGRERLRGRLVRRGLTLSVGLWKSVLSAESATAAIPAALADATAVAAVRCTSGKCVTTGVVSKSVSLLVEGAMNAMIVTKIKFTVLACSLIASGAVVLAQHAGSVPDSKTRPVTAGSIGIQAARPDVPAAGAATVARRLQSLADELAPYLKLVRELQAATDDMAQDLAAENAAVAHELGQLDIGLLTEEVLQLRDRVKVVLRDKLRAERRNTERAGEGSRTESQELKKVQNAYEAARALYLAKSRELRNQQRRLGGAQGPIPAGHERSGASMEPDENRVSDGEADQTRPAATAIGAVDMDVIFKRWVKVQQANKRYKTYIKAEKERLAVLATEFKKLGAQLERLVPDSPDFVALERRIAAFKNQYQTERETLNRKVNQRQARTTAALYQEVQDVIASVAKSHGMSFVVKVSPGPQPDSEPNEVQTALDHSVLYADPRNDLTDEVIRALNRRFEASGAEKSK